MANQIVDREMFTANQVCKVFQLSATKQTLFNAEERGEIPCARRVQRGKTSYRVWDQGQLAEIGSRMGFLHRPSSPRVVSVFSLKGGTSKSTMSFQLARSMALHGVRTLVIGLDTQQTVTQTLGRISGQHWEDDVEGVFHILKDGTDWITTVQKTDLSTLSYIPETVELAILDIWLKSQKRKEYILKERLVDPILASGQYDLVIFDCHPAWSEMVTGALAASHTLISPVGSDVNSFKAAKIFVELLSEYQDEMKHTFQNFLLIPTMVEPNKLSQTILAKYRLQYEELCSVGFIRRAIAVQEANLLGKSLMEVGYNAPVFQDFLAVLKEIDQLLFDPADAIHQQ